MEWLTYENEALEKGYTNICGVDEAGRGPLAGPVCAAAVILPKCHIIDGVNDSKKLTEKKYTEKYTKGCTKHPRTALNYFSITTSLGFFKASPT